MPEPMAVTMTPTIIGSMRKPDSVTPAPVDICRNVGRNARAANMPMPRMKPMTVAMVNVRFLNRRSGSNGSLARSSTTMNSAIATSVPTTSASRPGSPQS